MKICVWYHCLISGPRVPSTEHAVDVLSEQMIALQQSGLSAAAKELHISVNGGDADALMVAALVPGHSRMHINGAGAQSELATLQHLQRSLQPGQAVFYHHMKGLQFPPDHAFHKVWTAWRRCMTHACVLRWRECMEYLDSGFQTIGAHWMDSSTCGAIDNTQRYWGGNFWWATSDYLLTLPRVAPDTYENRYEAEVWIGKSRYKPRRLDMVRHLPMAGCRA